MYIDIIPNRNSPPAVLLRESHRENGRIVKKTIANLSSCPPEAIKALSLSLKGVRLAPAEDIFKIERTLPHGHVELVLGMMKKLGLESIISSQECRERNLVMGMIAQNVIQACSKLESTRSWTDTTLGELLNVSDSQVEHLYSALDWLLEQQPKIEKKLARRHLDEGCHVLFDVSSSSYHGHTCPLAQFGYNRDGEKLPSIVYGLLANKDGCPVAIDVYPGNTADPNTLPNQVDKLRKRFGLERVVLVGDRGMITGAKIEVLKEHPGIGWISALRFSEIRDLVDRDCFQPSLFDEYNLAEINDDIRYPGERLIVCYNPMLSEERRRKRIELLDSTETGLSRLQAQVLRRTKTPMTADEIGIKAGKILVKYKMEKHFEITISDGSLDYKRKEESIRKETETDGFYIVRTSEPVETISADDAVRTYKSLGQVEQAFRCLKSVDILVRPIRHRTETHVKAHVFLCMLSYYVQWHLRKALASVLFQDEELDVNRWNRNAVAPAQSSLSAKSKKQHKVNSDGWPVHSFRSLLDHMGTLSRNTCSSGKGKTQLTFQQDTEPTDFQSYVFELLKNYKPKGCTQ